MHGDEAKVRNHQTKHPVGLQLAFGLIDRSEGPDCADRGHSVAFMILREADEGKASRLHREGGLVRASGADGRYFRRGGL